MSRTRDYETDFEVLRMLEDGKTQAEVAKAEGIDQSTVSRIASSSSAKEYRGMTATLYCVWLLRRTGIPDHMVDDMVRLLDLPFDVFGKDEMESWVKRDNSTCDGWDTIYDLGLRMMKTAEAELHKRELYHPSYPFDDLPKPEKEP